MSATPTAKRRATTRARGHVIARAPEDGRLALDYAEAAWLLHCHPNTVRNLVDRGVLAAVSLGRRRLIPRAAVEALLACGGAA